MSSDIFRPVNLENYVRTNFTSIRTSKNEDLTNTTTYFVFCLIREREKLALASSAITQLAIIQIIIPSADSDSVIFNGLSSSTMIFEGMYRPV